MNNTLFIYVVGDNGASAEGGPEGAFNEMMALNGIINTAAINMPHFNNWGDPSTFPHYAIGWAWAGDAPFQWTKQIASHYGGTTNGMVIHWPARIKAHGEIRSQFTYVTDIAPTVLEAAGLPFPKSVNGTVQRPFDGTSMVYTFDHPKAPETHTTQYFEMFGNRGIYHDGWIAAARHSIPWLIVPNPPLTKDTWELYHVARGLQRGARSRRQQSGEAARAAGPVHAGGREKSRAADRRPQIRTFGSGNRRPARSDGSANLADGLSRHDGE